MNLKDIFINKIGNKPIKEMQIPKVVNMRRPSILCVMDKWCAANPVFGISEFQKGIHDSLESTGLCKYLQQFNHDEYFRLNQTHGDPDLLKKCASDKIDLIVLVIYKTPGSHYSLPTFKTLDIIKNDFKIPMVAIWGDIQSSKQISIAESILPFINFNYCTASSATTAMLQPSEKWRYSWLPKDPRVFFTTTEERDIPVSYIGSPKLERLEAVNKLRQSGIEVYVTGGERQKHLETIEFANILRRSKITLGFSRSLGLHVTNARTFEAMLCGTFLLEEEGIETAQLFQPKTDYETWYSLDDLVKKTLYYLLNHAEREKISASGCGKCHAHYSAMSFWRRVLSDVNLLAIPNDN
jgi:hypothetical protein